MEWIVKNWPYIVSAVVVSAFVAIDVIYFIRMPKEKQIANVKEWLKWAVTEAEKSLGGGTGALKLRMVYDLACSKFPWIVKMVPFETFSKWVDEALIWLGKQLESNAAVKTIVEGE